MAGTSVGAASIAKPSSLYPSADISEQVENSLPNFGDYALFVSYIYRNAYKDFQLPDSDLEVTWRSLALEFPLVVSNSQELARNITTFAEAQAKTSLRGGGSEIPGSPPFGQASINIVSRTRETAEQFKNLRTSLLNFWDRELVSKVDGLASRSGEAPLRSMKILRAVQQNLVHPAAHKILAFEDFWDGLDVNIKAVSKQLSEKAPEQKEALDGNAVQILGDLGKIAEHYANETQALYRC